MGVFSNMNKKDKIILGVGIISALMFLKMCQEKKSSIEQTETITNTDFEETTLDVDTTPVIQKWSYWDEKNAMDDSKDFYAQIYSNDKLYFKFPYDGGINVYILLANREGKVDAMLRISKGQFMTNTLGERTIRVRFDNNKSERYSYTEPSDGSSETIFIHSTNRFISKLKKAKTTIIECDFYDQGTRTITFNTDGLKWKH